MNRLFTVPGLPFRTAALSLLAGAGAACDEYATMFPVEDEANLAPVVVGGSLYFLHPFADKLVRVDGPESAGDEPVVEALDALATPGDAVANPAGDGLLVLYSDADFLLELEHPSGNAVPIELGTQFNRLAWSPDGRRAVLTLSADAAGDLQVQGTLSFDEIGILDGEGWSLSRVHVGFNPHALAFTPDGSRVVVLSSQEASVVDLDSQHVTTVPFALDETVSLTPEQVIVTADGAHAFVSVAELPDLFDIRLGDDVSVNILSLSGVPSRMEQTSDGLYTVLAFGTNVVEIVDNADPTEESTRTVELSTGQIDSVLCGSLDGVPYAFVYSAGGSGAAGRTAYLVHPLEDSGDAQGVLMENPVRSAVLSHDGSAVAVVHDQESTGEGGVAGFFDQAQAFSIVDVASSEARPQAVEGPIRDAEWVEGSDGPILVLAVSHNGYESDAVSGEQDLDRPIGRELARIHLSTGTADFVALPETPTDIGLTADGRWLYAVHGEGLGAVSFVGPEGDEVSTAGALYPEGLFLGEPGDNAVEEND